MTNNNDNLTDNSTLEFELPELPVIPAKRYFSLAEVCELARITPEQLATWQQNEGNIIGRGGRTFTRLDVIKIRQLQHGIADMGNQARTINVNEVQEKLQEILTKIEKTLAN